MHTNIHTYTCIIHTRTYIIRTWIHACIHTHTHTCIYTYIYTHINTYAYIIHTYISVYVICAQLVTGHWELVRTKYFALRSSSDISLGIERGTPGSHLFLCTSHLCVPLADSSPQSPTLLSPGMLSTDFPSSLLSWKFPNFNLPRSNATGGAEEVLPPCLIYSDIEVWKSNPGEKYFSSSLS
jgi:hypothetical protein